MGNRYTWPASPLDEQSTVGGRLDEQVRAHLGLVGYSMSAARDAALAEALARNADVFNVKAFGAKGDGVTDDTAAIQAAVDAAVVAGVSRKGATVFLPVGKYRITSTLILSPAGQQIYIGLVGAGVDATELVWEGGDATAIALNGRTRGLRLERFRLENVGARAGTGIQFGGDVVGTNHSLTRIDQLRVRNFTVGTGIGDASGHAASEVDIYETNAELCDTGILVQDGQSTNIHLYSLGLRDNSVAGLHTLPGVALVYVLGGSVGTNERDFWTEGAEIQIEGVHSENSQRFFQAGPDAGGGAYQFNSIRDCVINNTIATDNFGFRLHAAGNYIIERTRLLDGQIVLLTGTSARSTLHVLNCQFTAAGFIISQDVATAFTNILEWGNSTTTVQLPNRWYFIREAGNTRDYLNQTANGVVAAQILASLNYIEGDEVTDPTAPAANRGRFYFRDNGTGKTQLAARFPTGAVQPISLEGGLIDASAVFDPPSLVDGAGTTTTVTATGAALGDFAEASFSLDLQGITLTAWVSAADTVSVRFQNESGGTLDLGSGTLRVRVRKP